MFDPQIIEAATLGQMEDEEQPMLIGDVFLESYGTYEDFASYDFSKRGSITGVKLA